MKFLKKSLIFVVGIFALLFVVSVFVRIQKTTSLESGTLKDWRAASIERRVAAVKILRASDDKVDILVKCVDKMATLPDSNDMAVRDATELCFMGMQLKENI
ncbi:MAG: hypothetical protein J5620_03615 [Alphaproteobacteria bacterium]|nr:hypothetical protein [Alphaproteobacteria bacterium]